jgi:hypothetical protein
VSPTTHAQGWARLIASVADRVVATTVQDMHRAITDSGFRWVGPAGRPVKQVHDAVVDGVHGAVQTGLRGLGEVAAASSAGVGSARPSHAARKARAIAAGAIDADLLVVAPELDLDVALVVDGMVLGHDPAGLAAAHPDPSGHVVVFVHGLVDSDAVWRGLLTEDARARGATPLTVRYATGRPVGRNGHDLAHLMEAVTTGWPVPVTRLTLVAHSMGGLVVRAAGEVAGQRGHTWTTPLRDVVYLGTPHLGAWLEKVANVVSWTLRRASPHSAPLGALLDQRSRGIKDLRFGTLVEDLPGDRGVDDLWAGPVTPDPPWLDGVTHHLVVGRLREAHGHLLNAVFGDTMVRSGSAGGRGRWRRIPDGGPVRIAAVAAPHGHLVTHPDVADLVGEVLDDPPGAEARPG